MKKNAKPKLAGHEEVILFLNTLEHPLKKEVEMVRDIILKANDQLTEHIKWNAPSFCHKGEDRITFNFPPKKDCIQLVFHRGAKSREIKGDKNLIKDTTGLLKWATQDRAIIKFNNLDDIKIKKRELVKVVNQWIEAAL